MTSSLLAARLGAQLPRVEWAPEGSGAQGEDAADLAELAGLSLHPWQRHVLSVALREREDGQWSASTVALVVPRQNGKGSVLEALELYGLFVLGEQILHTAQLFSTSREAFTRLAGLIEGTPSLLKRVAPGGVRRSHGEEQILLKSGARLRFLARTMHSGRGLTADRLIYDEAYDVTDDHLAALGPTLTTARSPQTWFTSSSALAHSEVLLRVRDRGRAKASRMCYLEWSADPNLEPTDPEAWYQANPSIGLRFPEERIGDYEQSLSSSVFRREYLGAWPEDAKSEWVVPADRWLALGDGSSRVEGDRRFGLDVPWSRERATISVAGLRGDGAPHVELVDRRPGLHWVVDRVAELVDRWCPGDPVAVDVAGPAGALVPDLEAAGVEVVKVSGRDMAQACGGFVDRVVEGRVWHTGQPELTAALGGARKKMTGDAGAFTWDRRDPNSDISPLVAVTVALHGLMTRDDDEGGWAMTL